jgi:hypothetical protein
LINESFASNFDIYIVKCLDSFPFDK